MQHPTRSLYALLAAIGILAAGPAPAGEPCDASKMDPQMTEMMKRVEAAGTPCAAHEALEPLVGTWTAEVKCWMAPDAPPTVSQGTAKATWVMNGRFLQEEFKGEFMGKPFHGMSLTGYDNLKQQYHSVWIDDLSTAMVTSAGKAKEGGKVIALEGKHDCPVTGRKDLPMKQVIRILSPDKHVFEMHDLSKGDTSKTMEITYLRK